MVFGSMTEQLFDYQLDRHCSKTKSVSKIVFVMFDYQLDRHCSKTLLLSEMMAGRFDYQLDQHCSKTAPDDTRLSSGLITS